MIYVNRIPLTFYGVTQNEKGVYYYSKEKGYLRTLLRDFDDLDPKYYVGYKKYTNGSHQKTQARLNQRATDWHIEAGAKVSFDVANTTTNSTSLDGSYCRTIADGRSHLLVHTDKWSNGESGVNETVCKIMDRSGAHLHYFSNKGDTDQRDYFKSQGYNYYIRRGSNMKLNHDTDGIPKGAIGKIYSPVVTLKNGIPMLKLEFTDGQQDVKAKYLEFTNESQTSIEYVDDCDACKKAVVDLTAERDELIMVCSNLTEEIEDLKLTILEYDVENEGLEMKIEASDRLLDKYEEDFDIIEAIVA